MGVYQSRPDGIFAHVEPLLVRVLKVRVDVSDTLAAARETQGLQRLEQIKYAVLERSGGISIIPKE